MCVWGGGGWGGWEGGGLRAHPANSPAYGQGARKDGRGNEPLPACPSETCDARKPPKILRKKHGQCQSVVSLATVLHPLLCLFMDEEVDELGDGLEDLGIEIGVEFLYYAELCEN